ncbi:MAG TPA: cupredoxin family copper-binding protein [Candidatus Saccharimonadales bacterium]|nr:cupredoxin family copper-binding protein [Candidatus Saccharimonadales bacterium]
MNKKLVGGIIAIIAVVALIAVFVVTRPEDVPDVRSGANSPEGRPDTSEMSDNSDEPVRTNTVAIKDFNYSPGTIIVKEGTTVTWTNQDSVKHTVTGRNGGPDSELFGQGETYSYTFSEAGTFEYFCKPHPSMVGKVIVE